MLISLRGLKVRGGSFKKKVYYSCQIIASNPSDLSDQYQYLPTYPSPNPTLTLTCYQLTIVEFGEGQVSSCPDTDIDPIYLVSLVVFQYQLVLSLSQYVYQYVSYDQWVPFHCMACQIQNFV